MIRVGMACIALYSASVFVGGCQNKSQLRGSNGRQINLPSGGRTAGYDDDESPIDSGGISSPIDSGKLNPEIDSDRSGGVPTPILVFDPKTVAAVGVQELKQDADRFAWTVTQTGTVTYFKIAGEKVLSTKKWTGATAPTGGGARTYVLEGGSLVIVRSGGQLFFVDPTMPEGDLRTKGAPYFQQLSVPGRVYTPDARGCAVSYRRNSKRYVGLGIGSSGDFIEIPQEDSPPYTPQWSKAVYRGGVSPTGSGWGYSCYIDQQKLIYYGAWVGARLKAFNIVTSLEVEPALTAPNGNFASSTIPSLTWGSGPQGANSYAISGDNKGNVLNGAAYTMASDPVNQVTWVSVYGGASISVYPSACFTTSKVCVGSGTFQLTAFDGLGIGPLSALGDGSILGLSRGPDNFLYRLSLKDPKNIPAGINITKLAALDGDPYMYTDFTGATLYLTRAEQKIDLKVAGFDPKNPLAQAGFTWVTRDGQAAEWTNISFEMRCYASADPSPPPFEKAAEPIQASTKQSLVSSPSCATGKLGVDTIDIRLTQLNNGTSLMNIRKIQVTAYQ